jgi:hypothetical protein
MNQEEKIKLLEQTSLEIGQKYAKEIFQVQLKHGGEIAGLVMANVGLNLLVGVLSSLKEESRFEALLGFIHGLCRGLDNELAAQEVDALMERIKKGSKC